LLYLETSGKCEKCEATATSGVYIHPSTKACIRCIDDCQTCINEATCVKCRPTTYLTTEAKCSTCQAPRGYIDGDNCKPCDSTCLTCSGGGSNKCISCSIDRALVDSSCVVRELIVVTQTSFSADSKEVLIKFSTVIKSASGTIESNSEMRIFAESEEKIKTELDSNSGSLDSIVALSSPSFASIVSTSIKKDTLKVKIDSSATLENACLAIKFNKIPSIIGESGERQSLMNKYLISCNINLIVTKMDSVLQGSAGAVSATVTSLTTLLMILSVPQAFILMKVFQTIDFYVYIDSQHPSNFATFLEIISKNIMDYIPNVFEFAADNEGQPIYDKFEEYGMEVHVFKNLGRHFLVVLILCFFKLVALCLSKVFKVGKLGKYAKKFNRALGVSIFYGVVEAFHLDIVFSLILHVALRNSVDNGNSFLKVFAMAIVTGLFLMLGALYIFMGYTVRRLTISYKRHVVLTVKQMKDEPWRFILEDKNMGNIFQRHFNLICMLRDVLICLMIFFAYASPIGVSVVFLLIHLPSTLMMIVYKPFENKIENRVLIATNSLYICLDILFIANVAADLSANTRYFIIGFSMIAVVFGIILVNMGTSLYTNIRSASASIKKRCNKKKKTQETSGKTDDPFKEDVSNLDGTVNNNISIDNSNAYISKVHPANVTKKVSMSNIKKEYTKTAHNQNPTTTNPIQSKPAEKIVNDLESPSPRKSSKPNHRGMPGIPKKLKFAPKFE
jgi:hypothetical protein